MQIVIKSLSFIGARSRAYLLLVTLAKALFGLLDLVGIALIGLVGILAVSPAGTNKSVHILNLELTFTNNPSEIGNLVLITFGVFLFKAMTSLALNRANFSLSAHIDSQMAKNLAQAIYYGPYAALREIPKTKVQWLLLESVKQAFSISLTAFSSLVVDFFSLTVLFVFLFAIDPVACVVTTIYFGLLMAIVQGALGALQKRLGLRQISQAQSAWAAIEDAYVSYKEHFVHRLLSRSILRFTEPHSLMSRSIAQGAFLGSIPKVLSELALMAGVLGFVTWQLISGSLEQSIGVIAVFLASGVKIMGVLGPIQASLGTLKIAGVQGEPALEILGTKHRVKALVDQDNNVKKSERIAEDLGHSNGLSLLVSSLEFQFPDENTPSLRDIDMEVQGGSFVALIGPSGAGKTTLVDLILGLYVPTKGLVEIEGLSIEEISRQAPGIISYVPQKPGIVTGTIRENVTLFQPQEDFDAEGFERALRISHLRDFVDALPGGADYALDSSNAHLSGGQLQRIGLARALYTRPKFLILDEATSALDAETEYIITTALEELRPEVTLVVIAHRLSTVQHADEVFVIENGVITDRGSFKYLREHHPLVQEYVKLMSF